LDVQILSAGEPTFQDSTLSLPMASLGGKDIFQGGVQKPSNISGN